MLAVPPRDGELRVRVPPRGGDLPDGLQVHVQKQVLPGSLI